MGHSATLAPASLGTVPPWTFLTCLALWRLLLVLLFFLGRLFLLFLLLLFLGRWRWRSALRWPFRWRRTWRWLFIRPCHRAIRRVVRRPIVRLRTWRPIIGRGRP